MPDPGFHLLSPWWLLALPLPLLVWLWLRLTVPRRELDRYRGYADRHLLPHLLGMREAAPDAARRRWLAWSGLWALLIVATRCSL